VASVSVAQQFLGDCGEPSGRSGRINGGGTHAAVNAETGAGSADQAFACGVIFGRLLRN
jgi:hypothetical protein